MYLYTINSECIKYCLYKNKNAKKENLQIFSFYTLALILSTHSKQI